MAEAASFWKDNYWKWFHTFDIPPRNTDTDSVIVYKFQLEREEAEIEEEEYEEYSHGEDSAAGGGNYYSTWKLDQSNEFTQSYQLHVSRPWFFSLFILDLAGCDKPSELCLNFICKFDTALTKAHKENSQRKTQRLGNKQIGERTGYEDWKHGWCPEQYTLTEMFGESFAPGVSTGGTDSKFVLISLPYLGLRKSHNVQPAKDSCDLFEYMTGKKSRLNELSSEQETLRVYQARFLAAGKDMIAVFRSEDDDYCEVPQSGFNIDIGCAGVCLLRIISGVVDSYQDEIVNRMIREVSEIHVDILGSMIGEDEGHVQEIDNILRKRTQIMARLSFELSAVTRVVNYQISTLEKFVKVSKFAESNNMIGRQRITHDLVTILLPGKEKVQRELLNLIPTIKYLQKLVSQTMADRIAQRQTWAATKQAEETKIQVELSKRAQELSRQTQEQGKSVLVFTIITTIFLPMSFFTSYFGMNTPDIRETTTKQSGFWVICGPISAFVIIMALLVAFPSKIMKLLGINKKQSPGDMEEQRIIKED